MAAGRRGLSTAGPATFPKAARVRRRADYVAIQSQGTRHFTRHFVMVVRRASEGLSRLGITASKQVGGAVVRNRWKRACREAFRHERGAFPNVALDLVLIAKKDQQPPSVAEARDQLRSALRRFQRPP